MLPISLTWAVVMACFESRLPLKIEVLLSYFVAHRK